MKIYIALGKMQSPSLGEICGLDQAPVIIKCNNQGAIAISKDNKFHTRMKHIEIRYHYIRECVANGKVVVEYVPTAENITDAFTKPLTRPRFTELVTSWDLVLAEHPHYLLYPASLEGEC